MNVTVDVLLATFNGAKYLPAQIESILSQTYQDFRLLIRDDGSEDNTMEIIQAYQQRFPNKVSLIPSKYSKPGPINNFSNLIIQSMAPYIMLSDQDDFWVPEKIELSLQKIIQLEQKLSKSIPILVHSDLLVVDQNLKEINPSFFNYGALNPKRIRFGNLLVQNVVTGCASIFNRALAQISTPIPENAMMHDWWVALVASAFGEIGLIERPTVLYRQHGDNTLGAQEFSFSFKYLFKKGRKLYIRRDRSILHENLQQAQALYDQYATELPPPKRKILEKFLNLEKESFIKRRTTLIRYGFYKGRLIQNVGLFLRI